MKGVSRYLLSHLLQNSCTTLHDLSAYALPVGARLITPHPAGSPNGMLRRAALRSSASSSAWDGGLFRTARRSRSPG